MKRMNWIFAAIILVVAVFTGCSDDDPDPSQVAYDSADPSKGGIMYDKYWAIEAGFNQSDPNIAKYNASADFFRCKQCHGWDGLGSAGSYNNRAPRTTRPNVSGLNIYQLAQTKSATELFDGMKKSAGRRALSYDLTNYNPTTNATEGDKMPDFSAILTDEQIWDIVKFMKDGMFDVSKLYDATYSGAYPTGSMTIANLGKDGNEASGNTFYTANCTGCHGADGKTIALEGMSVGKFTRGKAYEVQHKVQYGQLGFSMVGEFNMTLAQMKDLYKALANTTKFPD
jgi:thiosulfate dehydrogenase